MVTTRTRGTSKKAIGFYEESDDDDEYVQDEEDDEDDYQLIEVKETKKPRTSAVVAKTGTEAPTGIDYPSSTCKICNIAYLDENNDGCFSETPSLMPCGHIFGNTCIAFRERCPSCPTKLKYPGCGHKIPLQQAYIWQPNEKKNRQAPPKCVHCTISDVDNGVNMRGYRTQEVLANIVALMKRQQALDEMLALGGTGYDKFEAIDVGVKLHAEYEKLHYINLCVQDVWQAAELLGL